MHKISIIVPIYNVEGGLKNTIDSIVLQTLTDIEIICVDDGSEDCSRNILIEYADKDSRIKLIFHENNKGLLAARKSGVMASTGKYIMFVDGDDELVENACEIAYKAIEKEKTDILSFGTYVVNRASMPEKMIRDMSKRLEQSLKKIETENLIDIWGEERFCSVVVWNKIYKCDICKKAFDVIEDSYFLDAEDWYASIVIFSYAESYTGIAEKLYCYNWGLGITGGENYTLKKYDGRLTEKYAIDALYRFAFNQKQSKNLIEIVKDTEKRFLNNCIKLWKENLLPEYKSEGFAHLTDMWGTQNVLCHMAEREWENIMQLSELLLEVEGFQNTEIRMYDQLTVALYVPFDANRKAEIEARKLEYGLNSCKKDKNETVLYNVVFITEGTELGEHVDESVVFVNTLPNHTKSKKENYRQRYQAWENLVLEHQIDIVVSWETDPETIFWDMLAIKSHKRRTAYVVCTREFCCTPYRTADSSARKLMMTYQMCDGAVVPSECDKNFVSAFAAHVKYIPVSVDMQGFTGIKSYDKNNIIWDAEISDNNHPLDMIHAMSFVLKEIPDAKLYMMVQGEGKLRDQMTELIQRLGVFEHVYLVDEMEGKKDYYKNASIYACTAEVTNVWNSLGEAMLYKLPVVSYDIPWLPYFSDGRGICKIKQKRWDLLAKHIIAILKSKEMAERLGNAGFQMVLENVNMDLVKEWRVFFKDILENKETNNQITNEQIIYKYLTYSQDIGKNRATLLLKKKLNKEKALNSENKKKIKALNLKVRKLEEQMVIIKNSGTYKAGKVVMYLPTKMKMVLKDICSYILIKIKWY